MLGQPLTFYLAECIDRLTGRAFTLRLCGIGANDAAAVAHGWGFVTGELQEILPVTESPNYWDGSHDLDWYIRERWYIAKDDLVDRHYFLSSMSDCATRVRHNRKDGAFWGEWACWQWFMEHRLLITPVGMQDPERFRKTGRPQVQVAVPRKLILSLERTGEMGRALEVCTYRSKLGLDSDTEYWMEEKADRLTRKIAKANG